MKTLKNTSKKTVAVASVAAILLTACAGGNSNPEQVEQSEETKNVTQEREKGTETGKNKKQDTPKSSETIAKDTVSVPQQVGNKVVVHTPWNPATVTKAEGQSPTTGTTFVDYHARYLAAKAAYDKALENYNKAHSVAKQEERGALELALASALSDLADARAELDKAKAVAAKDKGVTDAAKSKLDAETKKVETAKADRQAQIDAAMKAVDAKQAEINEAQKVRDTAKNRITTLEVEKASLEAQLGTARNEVERAKGNLETAREALRKAQETNAQEVAAAQERLERAEEALNQAREAKTKADARLNELKVALAEAKATLVTAQANYDAEVARISVEAAELKRVVDQRNTELAQAKGASNSAEQAKNSAEANVASKQSELEAEEAALARVKEGNPDELRANLAEATRKVEEARTALNNAIREENMARQTAQAEQAKYEAMKAESETFANFSKLTQSQKMMVLGDMVAAIVNQHRVDGGLNALAVSDYHNAKARHWSKLLSDTQWGTVPRDGEEYAGLNNGDVHDRNNVTGDARFTENVAYVFANNQFRVNWSAQEGGRHVERVNLDQDPMYLAWVIAQQWRHSPGHYRNLMDRGVSVMSVGLHYDESTGRIYATLRAYYGSSNATNPKGYHEEGLYTPTDHSELYGFTDKKLEFTGIDQNGVVTYDGQNNHGSKSKKARDWTETTEVRYAEGINDTRPTAEQVETQKGVADQAKVVELQKGNLKSAAENDLQGKTTEQDSAQRVLNEYLEAEKVAQAKVDEAKRVLELVREVFGEKSQEAQKAAKAVEEAEARLAQAREALAAVPGVDTVDTSAVDTARRAVEGKTAEVADAQREADAKANELGTAETEKAGADAQMAEANSGFTREVEAVKTAEGELAKAEGKVSETEDALKANAEATKESEKVVETKEDEIAEAEKELPALNTAVDEAKAITVDTSAQDTAKAEYDSAKKVSDASAGVEAEAQAKVDAAQASVNEAQKGIDAIDNAKANTEKDLDSARKHMIDTGKQAGLYPVIGIGDPTNKDH